MKTTIAILMAVMIAALASLAAATDGRAQQTASAVVKVVVTIKPQIAVTAQAAVVNAGTVSTGDFAVTAGFHVNSTTHGVSLYVCATDLYKGDATWDKGAATIPVSVSRGVTVSAPGARPVGGSNVAHFTGTSTIDGAAAYSSEPLHFENSPQSRFNHDVQVTVTWNQNDPGKPPGEYGGLVKLIAMVMP